MFQAGTDSYCTGSNCTKTYKMWLEKVDNDGTGAKDLCTTDTVNAGDRIRSWVYYKSSQNKYAVGVYDISNRNICTTSWIDTEVSNHYAQYIVERPTVTGTSSMYTLPAFADFNMKGEYWIGNTKHTMSDYNTIGDTYKYKMRNGANYNIIPAYPDSDGNMRFDYRNSAGT